MTQRRRIPRLIGSLLLVAAAGVGCGEASADSTPDGKNAAAAEPEVRPLGRIVPVPASVTPQGEPFTLTLTTRIGVDDTNREIRDLGRYLAGLLRPATGFPLPVVDDEAAGGGIRLRLSPGDTELGAEGYRLHSAPDGVTLTAREPAGLFRGVQTLRQQLPSAVERKSVQNGPWKIAGGTITDTPRYAYRGAMLDVSRHFFTVDEVKRYIDQLALYKVNTLHLHLSDDQGWRIAVDSWPRLTTYGGSTEVGGGPGGFYTKAQYQEIVRYAASRYQEVIPEIDLPGHTNAALASYAELNCDGVAPPLYTGTKVGFSSLCVPKPVTYDFVDDVIREIAALTPGRYIHIGGDEAHSTSHADYVTFMDKVQPVVAKYGKKVVGWHQLTGTTPADGALVQYWGLDRTPAEEKERVAAAARNGAGLVLSPADRTYLDMKYTKDTKLGLAWAGYVEVRRSYDWNPSAYLAGAPADSVRGIEAPLWTETLATTDDLDVMAFPRLPGLAELGWSPAATHDWDTYKVRLAEQAPRFDALGIDYYRSPEVPWPAE
ncbi:MULTISPECIES: beta-N-acetylhexosaminidase [unclassified Streptomyces]|uniref:beta-N-acetylhexosaminidase n=1 Tax=unclassified Streptomyces TaxID=2593676 RepID=UPI00093A8923|nr:MULTISPECIES: beta-N-acetylhexosaminidase [unclassified Streptomyces]MCD2466703.1 beta-N-acetylhexosaminidase [Streptomyces sp. MBT42]OKJ54881.1 beta-N-acetylhexosaminidase [Streptomyces sp. CB02009]